MRIEKVSINDANELLSIYAPYVLNTAISFETKVPSIKEFERRIKRISKKYPYIKAVDENNQILGYAYANTFKNRQAYDWSVEVTIYVKEGYTKHKIGSTLYKSLELSLKDMGILNLNACIAYPKDNDSNLNTDSFLFHQKMGYSLVGTFHNSGFKFNKWYDMIWMEKMLDEHPYNPKKINFGHWKLFE
jgi:L-amino acid N-acyltransferase YncA